MAVLHLLPGPVLRNEFGQHPVRPELPKCVLWNASSQAIDHRSYMNRTFGVKFGKCGIKPNSFVFLRQDFQGFLGAGMHSVFRVHVCVRHLPGSREHGP